MFKIIKTASNDLEQIRCLPRLKTWIEAWRHLWIYAGKPGYRDWYLRGNAFM